MPERQKPGIRPEIHPFPHQQAAVERFEKNGGSLVMAHGVGTGKSAASLFMFDRMFQTGKAKRMLVITPAGLKTNYANAVKDFTTYGTQVVGAKGEQGTVYPGKLGAEPQVTVASYEMFARDPEALVRESGADMLILDEFHRIRNPEGVTYDAAVKARALVPFFVGMTGSPVNNDPKEIVPLINLAAGREIMKPSTFDRRHKVRIARQSGFFGGKRFVTSLKDLPGIQRDLGPHVDWVTTEDVGADTMPRKEVEEVHVTMSPEQRKIYDWAMGQIDPVTRWKIRNNLPVGQKEANNVFSMIIKARQAANSSHLFRKDLSLEQDAATTPKVKRLLDDVERHLAERPDNQAVLYSNLIAGGVDVLSAGLKARGLDHALFVGKGRDVGDTKVTGPLRDQGVQEFKDKKKRVIVLSSAGAEGLDLKDATGFFSLDGHFNPERTRQAEARVRRLKGQMYRPPEERKVQIKRYFSDYEPPSFMGRLFGKKAPTTTDTWIHNVALQKHRQNQMLQTALKTPKPPASPTMPGPVSPVMAQPPKLRAPTRYLRRWKDVETGEWRYQYAPTV